MTHPRFEFARALLAAGTALACMSPTGAQEQPSNQAPAVRAVLPQMQVVRDPATGRLRAPNHEEVAAAQAASAAVQRGAAAAKSAGVRRALPADHPAAQLAAAPTPVARFGATAKRLDTSRLSYTVARRATNGELDTACVTTEDAALKVLKTDGANLAKEARHDH